MNSLLCLSLVVYMEARNQSIPTQLETARTALTISKEENKPICKTLSIPGLYSWNWDKKSTKVDKEKLKEIKSLIVKYKPKPSGRRYLNSRRLGRRFKTDFKMVCRDNLCFY